jgi:hypothetical protein
MSGGRGEYLDKVYNENKENKFSYNSGNLTYGNSAYYIVGNGECKQKRPERKDAAEREKVLRYTAAKGIAMAYEGEDDEKRTYFGMKKVEDALAQNGFKAEVKATRVHDDMVYFTVAYEDESARSGIDLVLLNEFEDEGISRLRREDRADSSEKSVCKTMALWSAAEDAKDKARTLGVKLKFPVKISEDEYGGKFDATVWYYFE